MGSKELKNSFSIIALMSYSSIYSNEGVILWSNILEGIPKELGSKFVLNSNGISF